MTATSSLIPSAIALATGVTLPYVERGDPAGVPVVFLHGYSDSWRSWELLLPQLPATIRAFALSLRGHGDASRPDDGYRPEDYAADVAAFLDAFGLDAAVIVGHSGGSYIAQRFAVDHPERTLGLVLVGAFHSLRDAPGADELWEAVAQLDDPVDPEFVREFQESTVARAMPAGLLDTVVGESLKLPARVWQAYLRAFLDAPVPTQSGTISAPTLIQWGDLDVYCTRSAQEALVAAIPGARLMIYRGTAHVPQWEHPERVAAEIAAFAHEVAGPTLAAAA